MPVDHGLGGKDGEKQQQKRAKKAHRQKEAAQKSLVITKGKKGGIQKEIIFDEAAREQFLTGFRQRKTQRRKFGLAMQVLKEKKSHKDALKHKKNVMQEHRNNITKAFKEGDSDNEIEEVSDEEEEQEEKEIEEPEQEEVFEDQDTQAMFGGSVAVVVDTSIGQEDEGDDREELQEYIEKQKVQNDRRGGTKLTRLEKALRQVQQSGVLSKKANKKKTVGHADHDANKYDKTGKKGGGKGANKNAGKWAKTKAAKGLMTKAMGSGIVKSTFKAGSKMGGKNQGRR